MLMSNRSLATAVLSILLLAAGCATPPRPPETTAPDQQFAIRNQGYSLLYLLFADEQNLSKLLVIKKEAPDLGNLLKDISKTSADAVKQLEAFAKQDTHLHIKMPGLPLAEQQTREAIGKTKAKELITKGGQKFEVRILLSQAEALTYGAHLAYVTKAHDTDPDRLQFLTKVTNDLQDLHQRLIDLIHQRWQTPAAGK